MENNLDYSFGSLQEAVFINRDNRFRAEIEIEGQRFKARVPNTGRMKEILIPGNKVWVKKYDNKNRKTSYDLLLVESEQNIICLDAHLANRLFAIWLKKGYLKDFPEVLEIKREVALGKSRIDFLIKTLTGNCLVEVKSVNLVVENQGRFPDAPTLRGTKHLEELWEFKKTGQRAAVVFILMREDAQSFAPHGITDPLFSSTLIKIVEAGVEVYAYKARISQEGISYLDQLPVSLGV